MTDFNLNDEQVKKIKARFGKENVEKAQSIEKIAREGDPSDFIDKNLTPKQSKLLKKILTDRETADRFFESEQAKNLLKKILGDK